MRGFIVAVTNFSTLGTDISMAADRHLYFPLKSECLHGIGGIPPSFKLGSQSQASSACSHEVRSCDSGQPMASDSL